MYLITQNEQVWLLTLRDVNVLFLCFPGMISHSMVQDSSQVAADAEELVHTSSKENLGSPEASELGSPRCTQHFDLYNMVVSYKRMVLFLEPVLDALELTRFLLGYVLEWSGWSSFNCVENKSKIIFTFSHFSWKMPVYSLLVCVFLNAFFCTIDKGKSFINVDSLCAKGSSLTFIHISVSVSGLVHSGCGIAVSTCCLGLPAGQVWGQGLWSWAPEEALPRCASQRPADSSSHQTRGHARS